MDVGRRIGETNRGAAEFAADLSRLPLTYAQRARNATKGRQEGEGFWESTKGLLGGYFGETEYDKWANEGLFASESQPDLYKEEIGEGEGDPWLDPLKKAAEIGTNLVTGAWMGGAKAAPAVVKSIPTSIALGTAGEVVGEEIAGEGGALAGEMAGIITGALTGGPKETARLISKLFNPMAYKRGVGNVLSKTLGGAADLADASPRQINKALDAYVKQAYPGLPTEEIDDYIRQLTPKVQAALRQNKKGTIGQLTDDPGLLNFEKEMT
ncbi:unnamed protein product, partial [marine sediment metagenome]